MKITPKVSVIVPVYNSEKYLHQCVDSIVTQTLTDIEIILVDDGSTDGSPAICDDYAARDLRVRVIHRQNAGMGVAYNTGMAAAKGKYIGFVESDDWIESKMYEELYNKAIEHNVDVVKSLYTTVRNGKGTITDKFANNDYLSRDLYFSRVITDPPNRQKFVYGHHSHWSAIYRMEFIEKNKIAFPETPGASNQDAGFNWQVYINMRSCYIIAKSFYNYRADNPTSSSNAGLKSAMNGLLARLWVWEYLRQRKHNPQFDEILLKDAFLNSFSYNFNRNCNLINKFRYADECSRRWLPYISELKFKLFSPAEKKKFLLLIKHPHVYTVHALMCSLRRFLVRKEKNTNKSKLRICGVPIYERAYNAQTERNSVLGCTIWKHIKQGNVSKFYLFGLPYATEETRGDLRIERFLGVTYRKRNIHIPTTPVQEEVRMLRIFGYAAAVVAVHGKTFPKYRRCHIGQKVVIVACGPTVNYAPTIKGAKYLALNHAIIISKWKYDYCFMSDYPAVRDVIEKTFDYGCINFFGKYIYDRSLNMSIPDWVADRAGAERFYMEGVDTTHAYHEIEYMPLTDFGTIAHAALSFLLYTRPQCIYLVGCDTARNGYFDKNRKQYGMNIPRIKDGYLRLRKLRDLIYPEVQIVSVNPIGLVGIFKDMYTRSFLAENPGIDVEEKDIISGE